MMDTVALLRSALRRIARLEDQFRGYRTEGRQAAALERAQRQALTPRVADLERRMDDAEARLTALENPTP